MPSRRSTESSARTTRVRSVSSASAVPGVAIDAERRKVKRQARDDELEDPLGRREAAQLVLAEVAQLGVAVERGAGRLREQNLAPVTGLADARRAVDVDPEVVALRSSGALPVWMPIRTRIAVDSRVRAAIDSAAATASRARRRRARTRRRGSRARSRRARRTQSRTTLRCSSSDAERSRRRAGATSCVESSMSREEERDASLERVPDVTSLCRSCLRDSCERGDAARMSVPSPGRALDAQAPVERLDPVGETAQAGAAGGVRAADAVVRDLDDRVPVATSRCTGDASRARTSRRSRAPRRRRRRPPPRPDRADAGSGSSSSSTGNGRALGQRLERRREPAIGEDRPGGCRARALAAPGARARARRPHRRGSSSAPRVRSRACLREPEGERERDEPLLRAVVEVPLEPPPLGVARLDEPHARAAELVLVAPRAR